MFLSWVGPRSADREIEPPLHLPVGVLGKADRAGLRDALQARGDIDAVAHQVAVALLDHVAEMDADPKFDALVRRDPSVALDHRPLDFNGAVHCVDDAAELDDAAVAGALDDAAVMHGDGRIDQVASERPQPRQNPVLVGSGKPANSRPRRTPRSPRVFGSRSRRYAAATVSAVNAGTKLHRFPEQKCINNADENGLEHGLFFWASGLGRMVGRRVGGVAA